MNLDTQAILQILVIDHSKVGEKVMLNGVQNIQIIGNQNKIYIKSKDNKVVLMSFDISI